MTFFAELQTSLDSLRATLGDDIEAADLPGAVEQLRDENLERLIRDATVLVRYGECVRIAGSGVVAVRSTSDAGHGGMAQVRGHRNAVSLVQDLTGTTRADATKHVRLGEALLEASVSAVSANELTDDQPDERNAEMLPPVPIRPWHAVLGDAQLAGRLSADEHSAILRGLGDPPVRGVGGDRDGAAEADAEVIAAWGVAAEQLLAETAERTADELLTAARAVRNLLDPAGAADRFDARFAKRSFARWTDRDGAHHARIAFDDEAAAWWNAVIDAALRPRRGGPRFVDSAQAAEAAELQKDPRSNEQLAYDLVMDVFRAGTLAVVPRHVVIV